MYLLVVKNKCDWVERFNFWPVLEGIGIAIESIIHLNIELQYIYLIKTCLLHKKITKKSELKKRIHFVHQVKCLYHVRTTHKLSSNTTKK